MPGVGDGYIPKTPLEQQALDQLKRLYGNEWYFIPIDATESMVKERVAYMKKTGDF